MESRVFFPFALICIPRKCRSTAETLLCVGCFTGVVRREVMFSQVCVSVQVGGTPIQARTGLGYPSQPGQDWGTPLPPGQDWDTPWPRQDWGTPRTRTELGYTSPPSPDWLYYGWYTACGFPHEDFLVTTAMSRMDGLFVTLSNR